MESTEAHLMEDLLRTVEGLRRRRKDEAKTIHVGTPSGQTLKLQLDLSETIAKVKAMIFEQQGTPPMQQLLIFREEQLGDDHRTLADYGVQHGPSSALSLLIKRPLIDSTGAHGKEAMASEGLRRRIQGTKTITVENLFHDVYKLEVEISKTIADVKAMVYKKEGTHPILQRLIFRGHQLEDDSTLEEHGIENGSTIHLINRVYGGGRGSINIYVRKPDGDTFTIELESLTIPIYRVRDEIRRSLKGIFVPPQHLFFDELALDDERTLADYNIEDKSTLDLALGPHGGNRDLHEALLASHQDGRNEQMEANNEIMEEPPDMVVNDTVPPADQFIKHQKRWSKYSIKVLVFAITMLVTYLGSASTLFSAGNMVFKICIGTFFIADAVLSTMMPPRIGSALVYLSCFLLLLMSYLLLVSANKYYGYAIFPVPLPIIAALLQHKLLYRQTGQQRTNSEGDQNVDIEVPGQAHNNNEEEEHFDRIFELSADIVNCGGLITVVFGNSMVGPVSAVGFLFFYTVALGLYLMMVTTVRTVVLTPHARHLAILLKVLLVITLITALIHGVRRSNASSA